MNKSQKQKKREAETLKAVPSIPDPKQVLADLKKEAIEAQRKFKNNKKN